MLDKILNPKALVINCDICDTRTMKAENYQNYEQIAINADVMIVNEKSKAVLTALPCISNVDETLQIEEDLQIDIATVNGNFDILPNAQVAENTVLVVNGCLTVKPGSENVLKNYYKIIVNGKIRCPKSMESSIHSFAINGETEIYPDDCTMLEEIFILDKYFPLRAKENGKYYAAKKVIVEDENVDMDKLSTKNVQFFTRTFVVPEILLEKSVTLFDESVQLVVVPADYKLVYGDVTLNETLFEKYGSKLFVYGNLTIDEEGSSVIEQIEKLIVKGCVTVKKSLLEVFKKLDAEYDHLEISRKTLKNMPYATVDQRLFEHVPDGVLVKNVAVLKIKEDVSADTILNCLKIENCAQVSCSEEQKGAVGVVGKNIAAIVTDQDKPMKNLIDTLLHNKIVNADKHVM